MMTLLDFYDYAESQDIAVCCSKLQNKKAFAASIGDQKYIALDTTKIRSEKEERLILAEEIGHCETNGLYSLSEQNRPLWRYIINQCEAKSKRWRLEKLVPLDELKSLLYYRYNKWEIAEELDVSEDMITDAFELYRSRGQI